MRRVKFITKNHGAGDWLRQIPGGLGVVSDCEFIMDSDCRNYDWLVVYDDFPKRRGDGASYDFEPLDCAPECTILVTSEPETIKHYASAYTGQFGWGLHRVNPRVRCRTSAQCVIRRPRYGTMGRVGMPSRRSMTCDAGCLKRLQLFRLSALKSVRSIRCIIGDENLLRRSKRTCPSWKFLDTDCVRYVTKRRRWMPTSITSPSRIILVRITGLRNLRTVFWPGAYRFITAVPMWQRISLRIVL